MDRFVASVRNSLQQQNWYGALTLALALPDMCVSVENGRKATWREYVAWFSKWVEPRYTTKKMYYNEEHAADPFGYRQRMQEEGRIDEYFGKAPTFEATIVFLSGTDCYCLRCAYIHEASSDITNQRVRETISRFHIVYPVPGISLHCNRATDGDVVVLQIQVDIFCNDICDGVAEWIKDMKKDGRDMNTVPLIEIHSAAKGF